MLIEITGTAFVNKGAELMLRSVIEMVRSRLPDAQLVMTPEPTGGYEVRARLGLLQKIWFRRFGIQWGHMGRMIHPSVRKTYGLVNDREIDVVMDASGFKYTSDWGDSKTVEMASSVRRWKRQGTKVIFLPQAVGPFNSPEIRNSFEYIAMNADLLFPRDEVSYEHVKGLVGERENIRQAPDFTNLYSGVVPDGFNTQNKRVCIIPNRRMTDKVSKGDSESYVPFLATCVKRLVQENGNPFILIHEGEKDRWVADQVVKEAGENLEIIIETDPQKIKGIIGICHGVISSRFHGLVSALSQGVPALGTSWSHKYETLFEEYGFNEGLVSVHSDSKELFERIDLILDPEKSKKLRVDLSQVNDRRLKLSERMWTDVFDCITK